MSGPPFFVGCRAWLTTGFATDLLREGVGKVNESSDGWSEEALPKVGQPPGRCIGCIVRQTEGNPWQGTYRFLDR